MITEDYVSFEVAKLLKEKGFEIDINNDYWKIGEDNTMYFMSSIGAYTSNPNNNYAFYRPENSYPCPTLQMAMKWLRIEHGIHIEPHLVKTKRSYGYMPNYININDLTQHFPFKEIDFCDLEQYVCITYDKACELTIKYCLENLI